MNVLMKEYGKAILSVVCGTIALVLFILGVSAFLSNEKMTLSKMKTDSSYEENVNSPLISSNYTKVYISKGQNGFDKEHIAKTLYDKSVYSLTNSDSSDVNVYGFYNINKSGTYNVKLVAKNAYGMDSLALAIIIS